MPYYRITASNRAQWVTYLVTAETPVAAIDLLYDALLEAEAEDRDQCADDACRQQDWGYGVSDSDVKEVAAADLTESEIAEAAAGPVQLDSGCTGGGASVPSYYYRYSSGL